MSRKGKQIKRITAGVVSSKKGFVISDPSYVLSKRIYTDFWIEQKNGAYGIFDYEGSSFAVARTAYGDGVYYDNHVHKYPVDAGVIALIPLELVSDENCHENGIELGEFVINELGLILGTVFNIPGEAEFKWEDGVFDITFSDGYHVHINTKCDEDEDSEDDTDDSDYSDCSDVNEEDEDYCEYIGDYDDEYSDCEDCEDCEDEDYDEYRDSYEDCEDFDCYGNREYTNDPDDDDYEE